MANGYSPYLLRDLKDLAGAQYPGLKVDAAGLTGMLLENSEVTQTQLYAPNGHKSEIRFKYKTRITSNYVETDDNCDMDFTPAYLEATLSAPNFVKLSAYIDRATMAQYMAEASQRVNIGTPPTGATKELVDTIAHMANALVAKVNTENAADITWGTNVTAGNNSAATINLDNDTTVMDLSAGIPKMLGDCYKSGFSPVNQPLIVGGGLFLNYNLAKGAQVIGIGTGIDSSKFSQYKYYADLYTDTAWNTNQIGVFDKGSIHLVQATRYQGAFAGVFGNSEFFTITLPVNTGAGVTTMTFDAQLKFYDCPTTITNGYTESSVTVQPGWQLILSKTFGVFQTPTDALLANDRLYGTNGALRFAITNT